MWHRNPLLGQHELIYLPLGLLQSRDLALYLVLIISVKVDGPMPYSADASSSLLEADRGVLDHLCLPGCSDVRLGLEAFLI